LVIEVASNDPLDKIRAARERDIRFVELQFTDLLGIVKGIPSALSARNRSSTGPSSMAPRSSFTHRRKLTSGWRRT
jgi:glutamine synthetase